LKLSVGAKLQHATVPVAIAHVERPVSQHDNIRGFVEMRGVVAFDLVLAPAPQQRAVFGVFKYLVPPDVGQPDMSAMIDEQAVRQEERVRAPLREHAARLAIDVPDRRLPNRSGLSWIGHPRPVAAVENEHIALQICPHPGDLPEHITLRQSQPAMDDPKLRGRNGGRQQACTQQG
jgi:hypothetical protein